MVNLKQTEVVAKTDIFTLLGLKDLSDGNKKMLLSQMQEIVVNDFFKTELPKLLSDKDARDIEEVHKKGAPAEEVINLLKDKIPDIEDKLFEKSILFKKSFVKHHLKVRIDVLNKKKTLLEKGKHPKNMDTESKLKKMEILDKELTALQKALIHYNQKQWDEGIKILASLDN